MINVKVSQKKDNMEYIKNYLAEVMAEEMSVLREAEMTPEQLNAAAKEIIDKFAPEQLKDFILSNMNPDQIEEMINIGSGKQDTSHYTIVDQFYNLYEAVQDAVTEDGELACPQCLYEILSDASCGCPHLIPEAKYRGRKVTLNKPTRGDVKKFKVYVRDPKTKKVKKVNFGHGGKSAKRKGEKTMRIRKSNPKARKNFRKRHNCKNPGPKTKARYWSCRKW